ncbi:MAG TPA: 50S ribosomal protein L24 [Nitrosopumilaceae archaeon]|nr:50S ribosomal protein L24 [Nitrosopumilaceae archaeon]
MKPTLVRNRQIFQAAHHTRSKQLGSTLSKELRKKYGRRSARVVEGDTVRVMRGEFKGIDGKVTHVSTEKNGIAIEGIKREKLKGGNVDIYIHTSNVMITGMNLDDKWRQNRMEKQKTKTSKEKPIEAPKEKPAEKPLKTLETKKVKSTKTTKSSKEKPKSTKKETKQTKAAKPVKKENK